jgi:hypothetical protein
MSGRVPEPGVFVVGLQTGRERESVPNPLEWSSIRMRSNPCNGCTPLPFIVTLGGVQGGNGKEVQCPVAGMSRRAPLSVRTH